MKCTLTDKSDELDSHVNQQLCESDAKELFADVSGNRHSTGFIRQFNKSPLI